MVEELVYFSVYSGGVSLLTCIGWRSWSTNLYMVSCCRTAVGVGQRALSLSAHTVGGPPPSLPQGGWRHHAIFLEYSWYYCDVAAAGNGWF